MGDTCHVLLALPELHTEHATLGRGQRVCRGPLPGLEHRHCAAQDRDGDTLRCGCEKPLPRIAEPLEDARKHRSIVPLGVANELRVLLKLRLGSERGGPALPPLCDGLQRLLVVERRCLDRHYRRRGVRTPCPPRPPRESRSGGHSCSRRWCRRSGCGRAPAVVRGCA